MAQQTEKSQALFERACKVLPGGVNSPVRAFNAVGGCPRFMARASGARLWDVDGNEYIDCIGSWGPMILGHGDPEVVEAVQKAVVDGMSFGAATGREAEMGELISQLVPQVEMIRMVNSGTEAVMSALRAAQRFHPPQQDRQVRRLLPRPRRQYAGQGRLRRPHRRGPGQRRCHPRCGPGYPPGPV